MVRIVFIHGRFPAGGAERVTIDIARYLHSVGGYAVYVYASRVAQSLITEDIANAITIRRIPSQAIQSYRSKVVERFIVEDKIDVVVQVTKSLYGIEGIKCRTGVKTIVANHGEPFWQRYAIVNRRQSGVVRQLMWHLYNKRRFADGRLAMEMAKSRTRREYESCDAFVVLCDAYKRDMEQMLAIEAGSSHICAIENMESVVENPNLDKEKMLLFCGRFENWSKCIDRLLRIWAEVQGRLSDWRLVLVGDGPDKAMLERMAEELHLERVSFEGRRSDVAYYYDKASVVCLTSKTEGWPLALCEGQARGCIGVAFGCTAGVETILSPSGKCGFVVAPFDEKQYAETLLHIASLNKESEMQIRRDGVAKCRNYAPHIIAEKWRKLFDTLAQR